MADVNRGDRPLSPHLSIYRPQWTSTLSILHRITGVGLTLGALLVVWWLFAAATDEAYFAYVDGLITSPLGNLVMFVSLWALAYHTVNGIRHLWWDMGLGLDVETAEKSGKATVAASALITLLVVFAL